MIIRGTVVCKDQETWDKITPEDYELLKSLVLNLSAEKSQYYWSLNDKESLMDLDLVSPLLDRCGLTIEISNFKNNYMLHGVGEKIRKLEENFGLLKQSLAVGESVVSIHVANIGLLAIKEVEVLENCCTNELQGRLDEGWSILAICPPNAQRRPDYIIGRGK